MSAFAADGRHLANGNGTVYILRIAAPPERLKSDRMVLSALGSKFMQTVDILEFVRRRPFKPFRITSTDGRTYEIHHPELAMVGLSNVVIGVPAPNYPDPVFQRAITVDLAHIMEAEELRTPVAPPSN